MVVSANAISVEGRSGSQVKTSKCNLRVVEETSRSFFLEESS